MTLVLIFSTLVIIHVATTLPIISDDETKLNSIVISEITFPTEATIVDQEIVVEPASSFLDLVENYEGMYGSEVKEDELMVQKRSSTNGSDDDDESFDSSAGGKSLIDKIETPDPEVRKEFENELVQNQILKDDDETTENTQIIGTEYDPNYERKTIVISQFDENVTENQHNESSAMTVHDKENLQVHLVEQLVHHNENRHEVTTIIPESSFENHTLVKNPEIVEVLEHIVYENENELKMHEHSTLNPINVVQMEVDPIEIIPKDRHREAKTETSTENNDKFAGFIGIPSDDLIQPGKETTEPDNFFKKTDTSDEDGDDPIDTVRETLEYVAIYGKSLKIDDATTTEVPQTTTAESIEENKTEITEVSTKVPVNVQVGSENESNKSSSSEESGQQSVPSKSSEESSNSDEIEKTKKANKVEDDSTSSEEIEAENVGREDLSDERLNLRSLEFPVTQRPNALPEEIFKDSSAHEIKKKDHPDGLALPYDVTQSRQLTDVTTTKVTQLTETTTPGNEVATSSTVMETMTKVYEAFEEVVTAVTDGIQLSKELKNSVESFREDSAENKIILDTHSEAISSKNSKNPLVDVNDLEMMKLKERSFDDEPKLSVVVIPLVGVISLVVLVTLYIFIKGKASSVRLY